MAEKNCHSETEMFDNMNDGEPMENENVESDTQQNVEEEDVTEEDFQSLNTQLDALNSALDALENKNDNIHAQLVELLYTNREARQQFQDSTKIDSSSKEDPSRNTPSSKNS